MRHSSTGYPVNNVNYRTCPMTYQAYHWHMPLEFQYFAEEVYLVLERTERLATNTTCAPKCGIRFTLPLFTRIILTWKLDLFLKKNNGSVWHWFLVKKNMLGCVCYVLSDFISLNKLSLSYFDNYFMLFHLVYIWRWWKFNESISDDPIHWFQLDPGTWTLSGSTRLWTV